MKANCTGGLWLLIGMMSVGCGRSVPTGPPHEKTYPVTGVVHVDGSAADGVDIVFVPQSGAKVKSASLAHTGSDGKFSAATYVGNDGLPEGTYKLTFVMNVPEPSFKAGSVKDQLNGAYAKADDSKIEVTVAKDQKVDMGVIELSTKGPSH